MAKPEKEIKEDEATEADVSDEAEEGAEDDAQESDGRKFAGKKLILFYVLPAFLAILIGVVLVLVLFDNELPSGEAAADEEISEAQVKEVLFYELPEMLVNLNSKGRKASYLKISVSLELEDPKDIKRIEAVMPRIVDKFQVYLRELRIEDLSGSAGVYRLREELLRRVTAAAEPAKVRDILFKEMLVQ